MKPLFMWAGGKSRLIKHYKPYLPKNVSDYYEPFFGAGAMFIHVMNTYDITHGVINDVNSELMGIYKSIRDNVHEFIALADSYSNVYLPMSKSSRRSYYYTLREIYAVNYHTLSDVEQSALLFFLLKTGFNGIWQSSKIAKGRYYTPVGLLNHVDSVYDVDNVLAWNRKLRNITICSGTWQNNIMAAQDTSDTMIYCDPPYRGSFTSYGVDFSDNEQKEVASTLSKFKHASVYLANRDLDDGFFDSYNLNKVTFPITYTAGRRKKVSTGYEAKKATELLLYNKERLV